MADAPAASDPFEARTGRVAALARRLGVSEGQLYSMVIGLLLLWVISANGLPNVVWDPADGAAASVAFGPNASGARVTPSTPREAPPAGLIRESPAPALSPVTVTPTIQTFPQVPPPSPDADGRADPAPELEVEEDPGRLRIVRGGYASAAAGSPLATLGVPDGSVAVARRAGQPFHVTYLQLDGKGPTLELVVDTAGANAFDTLAALSLCVVPSSGWQVGHGDTAIEDAPTYDCREAVHGERGAAGDRWIFDTSDLDPSAIGGVAIIPTTAAGPPEFQVVFSLG